MVVVDTNMAKVMDRVDGFDLGIHPFANDVIATKVIFSGIFLLNSKGLKGYYLDQRADHK